MAGVVEARRLRVEEVEAPLDAFLELGDAEAVPVSMQPQRYLEYLRVLEGEEPPRSNELDGLLAGFLRAVQSVPSPEGFETVGGYVIAHLGRVPVVGERFDADGLTIEILDVERRRINKVRISRHVPIDVENGVGEKTL